MLNENLYDFFGELKDSFLAVFCFLHLRHTPCEDSRESGISEEHGPALTSGVFYLCLQRSMDVSRVKRWKRLGQRETSNQEHGG